MSEKKVALILSHMAEQAAPGAEIDLWPALQTRLANASLQTSTTPHKRRGFSMNTLISSRLRVAALLTIAILLACTLFLITPQGQAWAQSVLRFFTRQNDVQPMLQNTRVPTPSLVLVDQTTQTPLPTVIPTPAGCNEISTAHCPIAQIQPEVSFPILQLAKLPKGMALNGAVVNGQRVTLVYNCPTGCNLLLSEEPSGQADAQSQIGASAQVKTVSVRTDQGTVAAEYVQGTFTGKAGDANLTWDSNFPNYTLRWATGGIQYAIQWLLPPSGKAELTPDADMMVALAESLTDHPQAALNPNRLSLMDASLLAGFAVRTPTFVPEDRDVPYYAYDAATGFVCLNYPFLNGSLDHPRMFIRESATAPLADLKPDNTSGTPSSLQSEAMQVGGADPGSARYTRGAFIAPEKGCNGIFNFGSVNAVLQWTSQGVSYEIYADNAPVLLHSVSKQEFVRMAESITGVVTIAADAPDPEHLKSVQEAEKLAGFAVKAPGQLPKAYLLLKMFMDHTALVSIYHAPSLVTEVMDNRAQPANIYIYQCPVQPDGQDPCNKDIQGIPEEVKEVVQVKGQTGFYADGDLCADESTNWKKVWYPNCMDLTQRLYWKEGNTIYLLKLMWGGGIDKEMMIRIAENLK
jgi:hypothetical protein